LSSDLFVVCQKLAYASESSSLSVRWEGFVDGESGIETFYLSLWTGSTCTETARTDTSVVLKDVNVVANYTSYTFTNITLEVRCLNLCEMFLRIWYFPRTLYTLYNS